MSNGGCGGGGPQSASPGGASARCQTIRAPTTGSRASSATVKTAYSAKIPSANSALRPLRSFAKLYATGCAAASQSMSDR